MTQREMLNAVIANEITEDVIEKATEMLTKMDEANSKRAAKAAEKRAQNTEFVDRFVEALTDEFQTATQLIEKLEGVIVREDGKALNTQFISRLAKSAVEMGKAVKADIKVEGVKGTHKGYKLA